MIDTEGLKFETVMGALKSNNERWGFKVRGGGGSARKGGARPHL
jgi:hypothetical protein